MKSPKRQKSWPMGMPRRPDSNFDRELVSRSYPTPNPNRLPLVHVTATVPAKRILSAGKIEAKICDVFQRALVYFFVLRPAYRSKFGAEESHQLSRFPVVFVLKPEAVTNPVHAYPFDTGGAAKGAFANQADKYVYLEDYALSPTHEAVAGFVGWAFGTLDSYFDGRLRLNLEKEVKPFESITSGYIDIARMGVEGSNDHDKRASTIEVAASHDVALAGNVQLVVLPKQFLEGNDSVWEELKKLRLPDSNIKAYDWQPNRRPDEFQKEILRICRDWYREMGLLS